MRYRIDTILKHDNGRRERLTDWCTSMEEVMELFNEYVDDYRCIECLVYDKEKQKDILWYTP